MNPFDSLLIDPVVLYYVSTQNQRRYWTRPIYESRNQDSEYVRLFPEPTRDEEKFQNYYRTVLRGVRFQVFQQAKTKCQRIPVARTGSPFVGTVK
jgi:hypothetical protein